jgi:hypothetical protein
MNDFYYSNNSRSYRIAKESYSLHIGELKQRLNFEGLIKVSHQKTSVKGHDYWFCKIYCGSNVVVHISNQCFALEGTFIRFSAKVSAHIESRGCKQTIVHNIKEFDFK